jgi:hypothetical protein
MQHLFDYAKYDGGKCTAGVGHILYSILYQGITDVLVDESEYIAFNIYCDREGIDKKCLNLHKQELGT